MKNQSKLFNIMKLITLLAIIPFICEAQTDIEELLPVSLEKLAQERGMGALLDVNNVARLEAILTDNYNSNSVTGNNTIDTGSLNEAAGVFSIIQNTGNNVIIQDSTIITVTITPD